MRFRDQVVLITGAGRGQGRAHALGFAREGAHLLLCDTLRSYSSVPYLLCSADDLLRTAGEIEAMGQCIIVHHADVTDLNEMQKAADRAIAELGPIDIVVANAGLYSFATTWELTEEQWDETVAVALKGAWITCKTVIPHMLARKKGKIICIGSIGSFKGLPGLGHYVAAKHGIMGLVKTLAVELAPYNINVNAVCPTTVDTDMINNQAFYDYFAGGPGPNATRENVIARMNEMNLFRDRGIVTPEDITAVVLWLASSEASHITGCALPVDAGFLTR
ncbi:MAG TPA: mycofactocin-coupled SDR family oxidoreductase [Ktedonobacteraceae bacterium]|nr:mycofactocin-coupled SDR family oxidoreductase [Ktedonobacteraceae bacterium]HZU66254.1 mycofactocin-coupled SDR family oxidoreductase [Ktedonobacteraceae bacterium]